MICIKLNGSYQTISDECRTFCVLSLSLSPPVVSGDPSCLRFTSSEDEFPIRVILSDGMVEGYESRHWFVHFLNSKNEVFTHDLPRHTVPGRKFREPLLKVPVTKAHARSVSLIVDDPILILGNNLLQ
jgi:hypothetical protein